MPLFLGPGVASAHERGIEHKTRSANMGMHVMTLLLALLVLVCGLAVDASSTYMTSEVWKCQGIGQC